MNRSLSRRAPRLAGLALLTLAVGGCAVDSTRLAAGEYRGQRDRAGEFQAAVRQPQQRPPLVVNDALPRFARQSIPLQRAASLPTHIGKVSMHYPGRHSLSTVAELISRLIGIPVLMTQDALAGAAAYAPGGAAAVRAPVVHTPTTPTTPPPAEAGLLQPDMAALMGNLSQDDRNLMELNYSGPLSGLLDQVANQAELQWDYLEGKIVFSRVVTRAISFKALPNGLSSKGSVGSGAVSYTHLTLPTKRIV